MKNANIDIKINVIVTNKERGIKMKYKDIKSKRYVTMNLLNGSVHLIVARNYWKALKKAKRWVGDNSKIKVIQDTLSTH